MLKKIYHYIMSFSDKPQAPYVLGIVSFLESSIFPLPPDPLFLAMALKRKDRVWSLALLCTITSVLGGIVGYYIGFLLYETVGAKIIHLYGLENNFVSFQKQFQEWGVWLIIAKGLTPIPYKLVAIGCGLLKYSMFLFLGASIIARGMRFFAFAAILWRFGPRIQEWIERYLTLLTLALLASLILGILIFKWL